MNEDEAVVEAPALTAVQAAAKPRLKPGPKKGWKKGTVENREPREPIRAESREPIRTRRKSTGGRFHIPPELLARLKGRSVEWKRYTCLNQEDPAYMISLKEVGWEPVQSHQMPGLMPHGHKGAIIRDGLMLMERPQELTDQARAEDQYAAKEVIEVTERRLGIAGPGEMTRDHPEVQPRISKTYEPLSPRAR